MSSYVVGTRVWLVEDSSVGTVTDVISGNVYRVKWDTPVGNGHIADGVYSKDWLDMMCVVNAVLPEEVPTWYPKPGMTIKNRINKDDTGIIASCGPDKQVVVQWSWPMMPLKHRTEWLTNTYEPVPDGDVKDPRTWVKVVQTVDTPLTVCPFCGSYNQELIGTIVKCRGCSARADIEDWNKRLLGGVNE